MSGYRCESCGEKFGHLSYNEEGDVIRDETGILLVRERPVSEFFEGHQGSWEKMEVVKMSEW
jgi:hypothetical protein